METLFGIEQIRGEDQAPNFAKEYATLSNKMNKLPTTNHSFQLLALEFIPLCSKFQPRNYIQPQVMF